jgi:hypothetical protein
MGADSRYNGRMPLHDHCRPPLDDLYPWSSIHTGMLAEITRDLNQRLPPRFFALETRKFGNEIEVDIATFDREPQKPGIANGPPTATLVAPSWAPPAPVLTMEAVFPDVLEVRVFSREDRSRLVGAIELVSPSNKDRPASREAFVAKCAAYLADGVSLIVLDATTDRRARLHEDLLRLYGRTDEQHADLTMFAGAYRPVLRNEKAEIDVWVAPVEVGDPLPTMPLRLTGDLMVPVDFEVSYMNVCRDRRMF